jgi:hypothetical protein
MKKGSVAVFGALLLLLSAGAARAQNIVSPYKFLDYDQYVGVFGGYINLAKGEMDAGPHSAPTIGGRWAYRVSAPLSIGVEATFTPTKRTVHDTIFTADSTFRVLGEADVNLLTAMANFRLNIMGPRTWNGLHPYLLLGGGVAIDLAGASEAEADLTAPSRFDLGTSFAGQAGAGTEWYPSQRFSLGVDVRNMVWKLKTPENFLLSSHGKNFTGSRWEQNFMVSAGLSIHF